MTSSKNVLRVLAIMALAAVVISGCERPGATDPLPAGTAAPQVVATAATATPGDFPPAAGTQAVINATPAPTATPLPQTGTIQAATVTVATLTPLPTSAATPVPTQPAGSGTTYTVQAGDRLFSIGRQFGVNPYSIAQLNNILPPYVIHPGQVLKIPTGGAVTPSPGGKTHVVAAGENLFRIALRYGTTVQALAAANNISNVSLIFVGQVLKIP